MTLDCNFKHNFQNSQGNEATVLTFSVSPAATSLDLAAEIVDEAHQPGVPKDPDRDRTRDDVLTLQAPVPIFQE